MVNKPGVADPRYAVDRKIQTNSNCDRQIHPLNQQQHKSILALTMADQVVEILSADAIRRTLNRLASEIIERTDHLADLVLVGIHTRGVPLAHTVAQQMERLEGIAIPVGELDITFYRDDLDKISTRTPAKSSMPCDLTGKKVVLVDDVIFSGRTIRAALNAVLDYGRPNLIRLAVLIDRGHRQLPIHPDFIGKSLPTAREEIVNVQLMPIDEKDTVELLRSK